MEFPQSALLVRSVGRLAVPMAFPARAFFQPHFMPDVQAELHARGVEVEELKTPADEPAVRIRAEMEQFGFTEADMVVGLPWYVELGLSVMGIPAPTPPDYPACLAHLVRRRIWQSTLGQVEADLGNAVGAFPAVFVKPAGKGGAKIFSGMVLSGPVDESLSGEFGLLNPEIYPLVAQAGGREAPVLCSEVLEMNSECLPTPHNAHATFTQMLTKQFFSSDRLLEEVSQGCRASPFCMCYSLPSIHFGACIFFIEV